MPVPLGNSKCAPGTHDWRQFMQVLNGKVLDNYALIGFIAKQHKQGLHVARSRRIMHAHKLFCQFAWLACEPHLTVYRAEVAAHSQSTNRSAGSNASKREALRSFRAEASMCAFHGS